MAYSALTPFHDVTLELLGFGTEFKDGVARLAAVREHQDVLDLGCGPGTLLRALAARQPDARYAGLDPDHPGPGIPADVVKRLAMREVHRVLRPGGRFLFVDFGKPQTAVARALLRLGSVFDGRADMRTNLAGGPPGMLAVAGFSHTEIAPGPHGVRYILCRPQRS